jgi:sulfite reductase (ferredoxin)
MERMHINDLETQLEPIFVYFKRSRDAGESFGDFCTRMGFDAIRDFAASYETETASVEEITDDSDGLIEAMADSTTAEITDESNGQVVAIANTTTAASKNRRRISLQDSVYQRLKETAANQGKSMTQLVNEAIETYLKNLS